MKDLFLFQCSVGLLVSGLIFLRPSSSSSSFEKTVNLGDSISIPCPLTTPGGSVQWLQNGEPIVLDIALHKSRHWKISPDGTAALTISDVRRSDGGLWECRELRSDGSVRNVAKVLELVVGSAPQDTFLELEGRRLVHQATITVREQTRITVHCVAPGAVPAVRHIHWLLGDTNITASSELFVEFSTEDEAYISRSVLRLNVTRKFHKKELICQIHHVTWLQSAAISASLNVLYVPSFSISREPGFGFPILEGMSVSLKCEVDANPLSAPIWVKDDGPLTVEPSPAGFLNFTPITRKHGGWYRCSTNHELGVFDSFGYFLNVRLEEQEIVEQPPPKVQQATLGEAVRLECSAEGRPEVTPVNKSFMAIAGRSAMMAGQMCSNPRPLRVFWIVRRVALRPGDISYPYIAYNITEIEIPHCYMTALEITHVSPGDAGEIVLIVTNAKGTADAVFILNVTQASFSKSKGICNVYQMSTVLFLLLLLVPLCLVWWRPLEEFDGR